MDGLLAPCDDPGQFVAAAVSLASSPERLARMRLAALDAAEGLSWEQVCTDLEQVLRELIHRHLMIGQVSEVRPFWQRTRP